MGITVRPLGLNAEYGVIAAGFPEGAPPDTHQHLVLNVAATQATTAVQNARLVDSLRRSVVEKEQSQAAERRAREEIEILQDVSQSLAGELELETVVQRTTDAATRLSGAKFGAFFHNATNQDGESYVLYTLSGAPREAFEKFGAPRNTGFKMMPNELETWKVGEKAFEYTGTTGFMITVDRSSEDVAK